MSTSERGGGHYHAIHRVDNRPGDQKDYEGVYRYLDQYMNSVPGTSNFVGMTDEEKETIEISGIHTLLGGERKFKYEDGQTSIKTLMGFDSNTVIYRRVDK